MPAIVFGSISTIADTSELQRQAFNETFAAEGLDWQWSRDDYREMLVQSGGKSRIAEFARSRGQDVDAEALHKAKSQAFQRNVAAADLAPRPGVVDTIKSAKGNGWKLGLVTTTSRDNIMALLNRLSPDVSADDFDVIVDRGDVEQPKPDKAAYSFALQHIGESAEDCVAIEDNADGVTSATTAGITCVAFPNANTGEQDFGTARRVDRLDADQLQGLTGGGRSA
ncbi:HAD-IA family hydrolase [Antrihabitans cavernicola]|uniref:HAD-IA family hydrolase n=1 Tax=Antrihabitans cavernicola TaxID=2495913 RepID=A0A5A7SCQ0_9NOCA|nr:HAD-IA family hydrolase [Spelaeibacter cavernicola]KAA0022275.1 HAD-IA family hydrolase [Spelaeibacter cavernicola]